MIQELLKIPAFAELYKNAPTLNVGVNHAIIDFSIPPVPPPPSIQVFEDIENVITTDQNNNSLFKKNNRVLIVIALSIVSGILIFKTLQWRDDYNNKKNSII